MNWPIEWATTLEATSLAAVVRVAPVISGARPDSPAASASFQTTCGSRDVFSVQFREICTARAPQFIRLSDQPLSSQMKAGSLPMSIGSQWGVVPLKGALKSLQTLVLCHPIQPVVQKRCLSCGKANICRHGTAKYEVLNLAAELNFAPSDQQAARQMARCILASLLLTSAATAPS